MNTNDLITNEELKEAFENTNFGNQQPREVILDTLLKCALGYSTGSTAKNIAISLGLVQSHRWHLTIKGREYAWFALNSKTKK